MFTSKLLSIGGQRFIMQNEEFKKDESLPSIFLRKNMELYFFKMDKDFKNLMGIDELRLNCVDVLPNENQQMSQSIFI